MKQIAQYQDGRLDLQQVPIPQAPPGGILVRVTHSVISPGTERMKVEQARMNLLQKAMARPDHVRKVLDSARTLGWRSALEKVKNRLEAPTPLGYSAAGVVTAVDDRCVDFQVGDRVACGGAECAHHAEWIAIPSMLACKIPDSVPNEEAAYTTVASIALHALRQADLKLGERLLVVGQGMVGLLASSLARASGIRVAASDPVHTRLELASQLGVELPIRAGIDPVDEAVRVWTRGAGVDAILLCAGISDQRFLDGLTSLLRDRGRLVIVGIADVQLSWKRYYEKEIEIRYSRSYGPGRYDHNYEWGGADYPPGYIRWTEQRNFEAVLYLMKEGLLPVSRLTGKMVAFEDAVEAYDQLGDAVGVVLRYNQPDKPIKAETESEAPVAKAAETEAVETRILKQAVHKLDVVGAGNFARTMLLPHLRNQIAFGRIANATSLSAAHVQEKFGFDSAETDDDAVIAGSPDQGLVIATRHHLHAQQVLAALKSNRHVFVEKPLCLTVEELADIDAAMATSSGSLMVGFNRRFAPATTAIKEALSASPGPKSASYFVYAGALQPDHWYANLEQSGGRFLGEACHFLDYFCYLFGQAPVRVFAQRLGMRPGDGAAVQVAFSDGSCGQLVYSPEGDSAYPKEQLAVFGPGLVLEMVNFREVTTYRRRSRSKKSFASKGHAEEMGAWVSFLRAESPHPLPYRESRQSMALTFAACESLREQRAIEMEAV